MTARGLLVRLKTTVDFLTSCRVFIGRDPRKAPVPALIIFPVSFAACHCGFAGILTLRRRSNPPEAKGGIAEVFKSAAEKNLLAVLSGLIPSSSYLGGINTQREMERELLGLKEGSAWKHIFYETAETQRLRELCGNINVFLAGEEKILEEHAGHFTTAELEEINRGLIAIRDLKWGIEKDVVDNVIKICALAGVDHVAEIPPVALPKYREINFLLNSLDRLEVRGRDSAGIQIAFVPENNADIPGNWESLNEKGFSEALKRRAVAGDAVDGSIVFPSENAGGKNPAGGAISFTYKTAQIVGELGENGKELRKKIAADSLFHAFATIPSAFETAFAHTRWASVGSITEENCHPIGNFTLSGDDKKVPEKNYPAYGKGLWTINVVLNGDIDNYKKLIDAFYAAGGAIAPELTTDAKVIPLQIERYLYDGHDLAESFRLAVRDFEGSHAIAMVSNVEPGKTFLALKGSGQAIYVGIAPERYLFSSELYGLVEETPFFIKMDGEKTPGNGDAKGQIFILDQDASGGATGIQGIFYDKTPVGLGDEAVQRAEITTRDIDRGEYPHYFLKEINEAVLSVRKTLRGKYRIEKSGASEKTFFSLGEDVIPEKYGRNC